MGFADGIQEMFLNLVGITTKICHICQNRMQREKLSSDYYKFTIQCSSETIVASKKRMDSGGGGRNRTGVDGFAGRCMATLPPRRRRAIGK